MQHQEVARQVATLPTHNQKRTALLDGVALFIAGADQSFAGADAATGYELLNVPQEGLDLALTLAAFTPAGATSNVARTLAEYVSGYDFTTGAPIDFVGSSPHRGRNKKDIFVVKSVQGKKLFLPH